MTIMIDNLTLTLIGAMTTVIGSLVVYIYINEKNKQNDSLKEFKEEIRAEIAGLKTDTAKAFATYSQLVQYINDVKESQHEIEVNYNAKFQQVYDRIAGLQNNLSTDLSRTRHELNNNVQRIFAAISTNKDEIAKMYISKEFCSAYHEQAELQIKQLKELLGRKAV